jgi:hypothetical protein
MLIFMWLQEKAISVQPFGHSAKIAGSFKGKESSQIG